MSSATSAASAATDYGGLSGGNITVNKPNYIAWAIAGVVAVVLAVVLLKKLK
jgi:hypothetical protein